MAKLTKSIEIEASPEKVFNFLNDIEKMNKAHGGFTKGEYTSKGPVGLGTTMHMVAPHGGSKMQFCMEVTEFVKNKKIVMHTDKPSMMTRMEVQFRLLGGKYEVFFSIVPGPSKLEKE